MVPVIPESSESSPRRAVSIVCLVPLDREGANLTQRISTNLNESQRISTNLLSALAHVGARREVRGARCEVREDLLLRTFRCGWSTLLLHFLFRSCADLPLRTFHCERSTLLLHSPLLSCADLSLLLLLLLVLFFFCSRLTHHGA